MWLRNTYRSLKIEYQLNLLKSLAVIHVYCFKCLIFRSVLGNVFRIMAKIAISKIQCPTFYISIKINGVSHHASVNLTMTVSLCRSEKLRHEAISVIFQRAALSPRRREPETENYLCTHWKVLTESTPWSLGAGLVGGVGCKTRVGFSHVLLQS